MEPRAALPRPSLPPPREIAWRLARVVAIGVAVTLVAIFVTSRLLPHGNLLPVGTQGPAFSLTDDRGAAGVGLPHGRAAVVEFFETGCPHCQETAPHLCEVARAHPEVSVLAVDAAREDAAALRAFAGAHMPACADGSAVRLLVDPDDAVPAAWKVTAVPTVYLLGADGRVVYTGQGDAGVTGLDDAIARLHG